MSSNVRGIFDGDDPPSTDTMFDSAVFDTEVEAPVARNPFFVHFHGMETIPVPFHSRESIVLR